MERLSLFLLFSHGWEPPHIHVTKDGKEAKIWLHDLSFGVDIGFSAKELNEIIKKARDERGSFLEAWNDHFAN
jgi:hypothetical protein